MIEKINKDSECHRYLDDENLIEYIFSGFDVSLPFSIKRELIDKFGKPRRMKLDEVIYENSFAKVTNPIQTWETQVVHFQPEEDPESDD